MLKMNFCAFTDITEFAPLYSGRKFCGFIDITQVAPRPNLILTIFLILAT